MQKNYGFTQKQCIQSHKGKSNRRYAHKIKISCKQVLTNVYSSKGHNPRVIDTIISSWRESTFDSYNTYVQLWVAFNNDKLVLIRFMKGLLQKDPPLPRYSKTWDLNIVLKFLKKWWPLSTLSLLQLIMRTGMLLSLCSGKRGQNLHLLHQLHG